MLIDTHIHLDRFPTEVNLEKELELAAVAGINNFIVPGVDRAGWQNLQSVTASISGARGAYGLHPLAAAEWGPECAGDLRKFLADKNTVAVGEIGLDRYVDVPIEQQEIALREQVRIAIEFSRPLLIHCRKMQGRLLEILKQERSEMVGGIMHAFGGSWPTAKAAIDLGFVISFGGTLTYPEARRSLEVLQRTPDDAIVIETDAPDLAPHPHRGKMNRPAWLELILARLAAVKGWSLVQAAEITSGNARRILKMDRT